MARLIPALEQVHHAIEREREPVRVEEHEQRQVPGKCQHTVDVSFDGPLLDVVRIRVDALLGQHRPEAVEGDPPQRHGPYYQWSRAVAGKTVSRRLGEDEAEPYRRWIANRRRIEQIIAQMERTSADAAELLMRQAAPTKPPRTASR